MPANTAEPLTCPALAASGYLRSRRRTTGEKQGRRVGHLDQAMIAHLEDADLVGGAKAVLDRAQDAELMPALALEIEHGIDHVLEHPRPGDDALFGHVADENQDETTPLRQPDQFLRRGADLTDCTGRAVQGVEIHRLDRIDDDQIGRVLPIERRR